MSAVGHDIAHTIVHSCFLLDYLSCLLQFLKIYYCFITSSLCLTDVKNFLLLL